MREHDRRRAAGHAFLVGEPPAQRAGAIKNVWSQRVTGGGAASSGPPVVAQLVCALRVYPHKHDANYPSQRDRGLARGGPDVAKHFGAYRASTLDRPRSSKHLQC
jgi:hypothetical protein